MKESYFIIIRGPLGIGKSSIAKELSKRLNAEYISIDEILEKNKLDSIDEKIGFIPLKNFIKANKIIIPQLKIILNNKGVIIDGNFYHKEQIENLIEALKVSYYIFTLKAPLKTCIIRDAQRKKVYGKEAAKAVHNLVSKFDYGINIDTDNKTLNEVLELILKKIGEKRWLI